MSTYWGYRCKQDGTTTECWFNHGEEILRNCARCYPLIQQLNELDKSGYIEVTIMAHTYANDELWSFLREHFEHGVELYNEYGESEPLEVEA